jgi:hypothetical protein
MRVVSLSVGGPRTVEWSGRTVLTSIFKTPTDRRLEVTALNIEGDKQSDLSVHGGYEKVVYAYPSEHYPLWRSELEMDLPWASFGENLATEGLSEEVRIHYLRAWQKDGTWDRVHDALREKVRRQAGRNPKPPAAILDSQSVKTTEQGGPRGAEAGKKGRRPQAVPGR